MKNIIFIGAGGHSISVKDSLSTEYNLIGYIDENKTGMFNGLPIFGSSFNDIANREEYCYFITIGDNESREKWYKTLCNLKLKTINIFDNTSNISKYAIIGNGNFFGKNSIVSANTIIGDNNIINTKALIEHECKIGNNCHISTNAVVNGNVAIGNNVFLGSTSVCIGQLSIGSHTTIGAGAVVINSIGNNCVAVGVPAKVIKTYGVLYE